MRTVQAVLFDMGGTIETFWRSDDTPPRSDPWFSKNLNRSRDRSAPFHYRTVPGNQFGHGSLLQMVRSNPG